MSFFVTLTFDLTSASPDDYELIHDAILDTTAPSQSGLLSNDIDVDNDPLIIEIFGGPDNLPTGLVS